MDLINLAEDGDKWRTFVNSLMKRQIPHKAGKGEAYPAPIFTKLRNAHQHCAEFLLNFFKRGSKCENCGHKFIYVHNYA